MLISFTFSNFRLFRDAADFSMVASRIKADADTLIPIPGHNGGKLLPLTAIFGPNAAGKSTFVSALSTLKHMATTGKLQYVPNMIGCDPVFRPTNMLIDFVSHGKCWHYEIAYCWENILHERLTRTDRHSESLVYNFENGEATLGEAFFKANTSPEDFKFASALAEKKAKGKPYINVLGDYLDAFPDLVPVFKWFTETLCIISPTSRLTTREGLTSGNLDQYSQALGATQTGITSLQWTPIPQDKLESLILPAELEAFKNSDKQEVCLHKAGPVLLQKTAGGIRAYECMAFHSDPGNDMSALFPLSWESDGTQRLMNLLRMVIHEDTSERVYVIDELDRSLHTWLSRSILRKHLELVREGHAQQMIFTTHDGLLMDGDLMRRDELWLVERTRDNSARLVPFIDFKKAATDKNLLKNYLQGRLGGLDNPDFEL